MASVSSPGCGSVTDLVVLQLAAHHPEGGVDEVVVDVNLESAFISTFQSNEEHA